MNPIEFKDRFIPLLLRNNYNPVNMNSNGAPVELFLSRYPDGSIRRGYAVLGGTQGIIAIPSWVVSKKGVLTEEDAIQKLLNSLVGRVKVYHEFQKSRLPENSVAYLKSRQARAINSLEDQLH